MENSSTCTGSKRVGRTHAWKLTVVLGALGLLLSACGIEPAVVAALESVDGGSGGSVGGAAGGQSGHAGNTDSPPPGGMAGNPQAGAFSASVARSGAGGALSDTGGSGVMLLGAAGSSDLSTEVEEFCTCNTDSARGL